MKFDLETARMRLRHFQDSDLESFLAYRNDPEVARYQGWDVPYPREKALEFVEEMKAKDLAVQGEWFQAAIEEITTGEMRRDAAYYLKKDDPIAGRGPKIGERADARSPIFGYSLNFREVLIMACSSVSGRIFDRLNALA